MRRFPFRSRTWWIVSLGVLVTDCQNASAPATGPIQPGEASGGCTANTQTDAANCGACGNVCPASMACVGSVCQGGFGGQIGPTVEATNPPPPLSGGTLLFSHDGTLALVSDPERDQVSLVNVPTRSLRASVALQPGDEPGRAVEDSARRLHVVLRGSGSVATLDLATNAVIQRIAVCPLPRGIAYDPVQDAVLVACAGGELVTLPAAGGPAIRTVTLDQDLRDVMIVNGTVYVTRFREAELLTVSATGQVSARISPRSQLISGPDGQVTASAEVAWRALPMPNGKVAMLHQYAQLDPVQVLQGGSSGQETPDTQAVTNAQALQGAYGAPTVANGTIPDPCAGAVVQSGLTVLDPSTTTGPGMALGNFNLGNDTPPSQPGRPLANVTLGIDFAIDPSGTVVAVASAGNLPANGQPQVMVTTLLPVAGLNCSTANAAFQTPGQAVAVAFAPSNELLVQTREPAGLFWTQSQTFVPLAADSRADTGHTLFHANAGGGLACASCHPEGLDDGHIWTFDPTGPRRTMSPRGNILARAPYHWDGDLVDLSHLMSLVFSIRMNGGPLSADQVTALGNWLNAQPALPAPTLDASDAALVTRGQQLFNDPTVGCSGCHSGSLFTNNTRVDVGTGGVFKVPSLVAVVWRAPYLHDGCATTLLDRFGSACGGGDHHGHTSQLASADLDALVAYLRTL